MIPIRHADRQPLQLLPSPSIQLLRLPLPGAHDAHLGPESSESVSDGRRFRDLQDIEATQSVVGLFERFVGLPDLLLQHVGALLVSAQVHVQLRLHFISGFRRCTDGFEDVLLVIVSYGNPSDVDEREKRREYVRQG